MSAVEFTATGRYYRVYRDGVAQTQHTTEREAAQASVNQAIQFPDAEIIYRHEYEVSVRVIGSLAGQSGDVTAPTIPQNLVAVAVNKNQIDLSWDASTDAVGVSGYHLFRDTVPLATVVLGETTYSDTGVSPSTQYSYTVVAFDAAGNTSAESDPAIETTPANTAPAWSAIANQDLIVGDAFALDLADYASDVDVGDTLTYSVFSGTLPTGLSLSGSVISGTPTTAGQSATITVRADDGNDTASTSFAVATYNADVTAPTTPSGLQSTARSASTISLSWTAATDPAGAANEYVSGLDSYKVYRDSGLVVTQAGTTFVDTGLSAETQFSYQVSAVDGEGNESALSSAVPVTTISASNAEADWQYRISQPGVVWYHNFASAAEVDRFRNASQAADINDTVLPGSVVRDTSSYVSGGGSLKVIHGGSGATEPPGWWRPFSAIDTTSGKGVSDPAAGGTLPVRTWSPSQGQQYMDVWPYQEDGFGPESTEGVSPGPSSWAGHQFYFQVQVDPSQSRIDHTFNGGKNVWFTVLKNTLIAQEIVTTYSGSSPPNFIMYRGGSPGIPNDLAASQHEAGWNTYLYHIVLGDEVDPTADSGGNTQVHVYRQDWQSGEAEYTKIFEKYDLGLDYQDTGGDGKGLFSVLLGAFHNGIYDGPAFYTAYDECIFSRQWIPPKSTFNNTTLETEADLLSAGEYALDPIAQNPEGQQYDISWQNKSSYWDDQRREIQYMGKAQSGGAARHFLYSEETNTWRYSSLDVAPGNLGHIWGETFVSQGDNIGDYYYVAQDDRPDIGQTIRYMDRSVEAGQGTTNSPWTLISPAASFELSQGSNQVFPHYHPNLMGPGRPGIWVGAAFRSAYFDILNASWTEVSTAQNVSRNAGVYVPKLDVLVTANDSPTTGVIIRAGEYSDTTPDTITFPIGVDVGTGNHGKIIIDPRDDGVVMLLESLGSRVWTSTDAGGSWTLESYTHPFHDSSEAQSVGYFPNDGGSWTPTSIPRYGVILAIYSNGVTNVMHSMLWRPG